MRKPNFITQLLIIARKSFEHSVDMSPPDTCGKFAEQDFKAFVEESMPSDKAFLFNSHCKECELCQVYLGFIAEKYLQLQKKIDHSENDEILKKTMRIVDNHLSQKKNIIDIVIRKTKEILEVIASTGEILTTSVPTPVRGDKNSTRPVQSVKVIKEMDAPPVSVQITFTKSTDETKEINLIISVFNKDEEDFMSGIKIILSGPGSQDHSETNSEGITAFILPSPGDYNACLAFDEGEKVEINISLQILKS